MILTPKVIHSPEQSLRCPSRRYGFSLTFSSPNCSTLINILSQDVTEILVLSVRQVLVNAVVGDRVAAGQPVTLGVLPREDEPGDRGDDDDTAETDKAAHKAGMVERSGRSTKDEGTDDVAHAVSAKGDGADCGLLGVTGIVGCGERD